MTHARLVRRSRENRDGRAQIYAQIYIRKEKIVIPTGVSTTSKECVEPFVCADHRPETI